jgi:hypothetical protein
MISKGEALTVTVRARHYASQFGLLLEWQSFDGLPREGAANHEDGECLFIEQSSGYENLISF